MKKKYKLEFECVDTYEESSEDSVKEFFAEAMSDNDIELVGNIKVTFLEDIKEESEEEDDDDDEDEDGEESEEEFENREE